MPGVRRPTPKSQSSDVTPAAVATQLAISLDDGTAMLAVIQALAKSSASARFIRASGRELRRRLERRLDDREWLLLVLDGKRFADDGIVIALGVTRTGEKRILGLVQTVTEHKTVCAAFLRELLERGFPTPHGLLVVLDGAKGLRAAVRDVLVMTCRCSGANGTSARTC